MLALVLHLAQDGKVMTQLLQCFIVRLEIRSIIVALVLRHSRCAKLS